MGLIDVQDIFERWGGKKHVGIVRCDHCHFQFVVLEQHNSLSLWKPPQFSVFCPSCGRPTLAVSDKVCLQERNEVLQVFQRLLERGLLNEEETKKYQKYIDGFAEMIIS